MGKWIKTLELNYFRLGSLDQLNFLPKGNMADVDRAIVKACEENCSSTRFTLGMDAEWDVCWPMNKVLQTKQF